MWTILFKKFAVKLVVSVHNFHHVSETWFLHAREFYPVFSNIIWVVCLLSVFFHTRISLIYLTYLKSCYYMSHYSFILNFIVTSNSTSLVIIILFCNTNVTVPATKSAKDQGTAHKSTVRREPEMASALLERLRAETYNRERSH